MNLDTLLAEIKGHADANKKWLLSVQFAVHDKVELIGQVSALHMTSLERLKELDKLIQIVECLREGLDNILNGVDFPIEGNEAAIALRDNLIAQKCLERVDEIAGDT